MSHPSQRRRLSTDPPSVLPYGLFPVGDDRRELPGNIAAWHPVLFTEGSQPYEAPEVPEYEGALTPGASARGTPQPDVTLAPIQESSDPLFPPVVAALELGPGLASRPPSRVPSDVSVEFQGPGSPIVGASQGPGSPHMTSRSPTPLSTQPPARVPWDEDTREDWSPLPVAAPQLPAVGDNRPVARIPEIPLPEPETQEDEGVSAAYERALRRIAAQDREIAAMRGEIEAISSVVNLLRTSVTAEVRTLIAASEARITAIVSRSARPRGGPPSQARPGGTSEQPPATRPRPGGLRLG